MSVAETLKDAAKIIREHAELADLDSFGSWHGIGTGYREPIKAHIQLWTPATARLFATVLSQEAAVAFPDDIGYQSPQTNAAKAAARSILRDAGLIE